MKYTLILLLFFITIQQIFSQEKKNIVSAEVYLISQDFMDNGAPTQLTYERVFITKKKQKTKMVSIGFMPFFNDDGGVYIFSLGYNRLYRTDKKHQFEHAFRFHYRIEDFQDNIYHDPVALMIYGGYLSSR